MQHTTAVLDLTKEIHALNEASLRSQQNDIAASERQFKQYLVRMLVALEALGFLIAFACVYRVVTLERRSRGERERAEAAEGQLRRLSDQLVQTQEEERRSISRELHDEVGQMLTGLRMELRSLRRLQDAPREQFDARMEQTKSLLDRTLQAVRDIAMGLRPSMLDDLGLGPALEWQGRDFSRRYDIPVTVKVDAALDNLPDHYRTNIFRIVQEALTNCARHAKAASVQISLAERDGAVRLTIADDGVGMNLETPRKRGLGLMGIQERVRKLGGQLSIQSSEMQGTLLSVEIPEHFLLASHD
jgi:signal transduction histidine kinase